MSIELWAARLERPLTAEEKTELLAAMDQRYEDLPKNGENKPEANSEDQPSGGEGA